MRRGPGGSQKTWPLNLLPSFTSLVAWGNLPSLSIYFPLCETEKITPALPIYLELLGRANEKNVRWKHFENCKVLLLLLLKYYYSTLESGFTVIGPKRLILVFMLTRSKQIHIEVSVYIKFENNASVLNISIQKS